MNGGIRVPLEAEGVTQSHVIRTSGGDDSSSSYDPADRGLDSLGMFSHWITLFDVSGGSRYHTAHLTIYPTSPLPNNAYTHTYPFPSPTIGLLCELPNAPFPS